MNYHAFQDEGKLRYTGNQKAVEEEAQDNLGFQHSGAQDTGAGFGLPNYFGDLPGHIDSRQQPKPIEISNPKRGRSKKGATYNLGSHLGARNRPGSAS